MPKKPRYMAPGIPELKHLPASTACVLCEARHTAFYLIDDQWVCVQCAPDDGPHRPSGDPPCKSS